MQGYLPYLQDHYPYVLAAVAGLLALGVIVYLVRRRGRVAGVPGSGRRMDGSAK